MNARALFIAASLVAIVALATDTPRADARCAMRGLEVVVLTPLDRPLPRGAGILVALRPSSSTRGTATLPGAATIGSPTQAGGNLVLLETIAPGLVRIPLGSTPAGPATIRGIFDHEIALTISAAPLPAPPPAPDVTAISVDASRRGTRASATLRTPAHPDVLAYVIATASPAAPISFSLASPHGPPNLVGYGRCDPWPDGARPPRAGDSLVLRYLDRMGQLSPPSSAVTASAP